MRLTFYALYMSVRGHIVNPTLGVKRVDKIGKIGAWLTRPSPWSESVKGSAGLGQSDCPSSYEQSVDDVVGVDLEIAGNKPKRRVFEWSRVWYGVYGVSPCCHFLNDSILIPCSGLSSVMAYTQRRAMRVTSEEKRI